MRQRWARRAGRWTLRALVLGVAVVALLVAVADTAAGRRVAERAFEWTGSVTSRGTIRIGRIEALPPGPLVLTDYEIIAPNGERVLRADRMSGHLDWTGFLEGRVRFRPCRFEGTEIRLTPGGPGGQVNLVYASEVPDGRFTVPLVWQDIELVDNVIHVRLPPKPPLVMRNVHGQADLHIAHRWTWTLRRNHGVIDLPLVEPGFREMNGRLTSDHVYPLIAETEVDVGVATPRIGMDYFVPAVAGRAGRPYFDLDFPPAPPRDQRASSGSTPSAASSSAVAGRATDPSG